MAFQFGAYDGGEAICKPSDLRRFACRVRVARRALLRHGMLASGPGDTLTITPQGEAYLTTGWLRTDEGVEAACRSEAREVPINAGRMVEPSDTPGRVAEPPSTPESVELPSPSEQGVDSEVDLKALLEEAKFESLDLGDGWYQVVFAAEMRTWNVNVHSAGGWLALSTHVMRLPKARAARALMLDQLARLNCKVPAAKFSATPGDAVLLELAYRIEHIDAEVLGNLIRMLLHVAETEYPALARVVAENRALRRLDAAFKRSA